jgi:hypothetical protein
MPHPVRSCESRHNSAIVALANLNVKPPFATANSPASMRLDCRARPNPSCDRRRAGVQLIYYAFDLLPIDGWDVSELQVIERKALLDPLIAGRPRSQPPRTPTEATPNWSATCASGPWGVCVDRKPRVREGSPWRTPQLAGQATTSDSAACSKDQVASPPASKSIDALPLS